MNFFNIGTAELLLIFIIALIVVGPRRLPEIARQLAKIINDLRRMSQEFTAEMARELNTPAKELTEMAQELKAPAKELDGMAQEMKASAKELEGMARGMKAPPKENEKAITDDQRPMANEHPIEDHPANHG